MPGCSVTRAGTRCPAARGCGACTASSGPPRPRGLGVLPAPAAGTASEPKRFAGPDAQYRASPDTAKTRSPGSLARDPQAGGREQGVQRQSGPMGGSERHDHVLLASNRPLWPCPIVRRPAQASRLFAGQSRQSQPGRADGHPNPKSVWLPHRPGTYEGFRSPAGPHNYRFWVPMGPNPQGPTADHNGSLRAACQPRRHRR